MNLILTPLFVLLSYILTFWTFGLIFALVVGIPYPKFTTWYLTTSKKMAVAFLKFAWSPVPWMWRTQKKLLLGIVIGIAIVIYFLNNYPSPYP